VEKRAVIVMVKMQNLPLHGFGMKGGGGAEVHQRQVPEKFMKPAMAVNATRFLILQTF
jgi:preprotein translocase subunit SecG